MVARGSDSSRRKRSRARNRRGTSGAGWTLFGLVPQARKLLGDQPTLDFLSAQLRGLREAVEGQVENALARVEQRVDGVLADLEERTARRLEPLLSRADVARKRDLRPLEQRLGRIEERVGRVVEEQNGLAIEVAQTHRQWQALRAELSERLGESSERLAEVDSLRSTIAELGQHLHSLAKERVAKGVEVTKLNDRVVRVEMRLADITRECGSLAAAENELGQRLMALGAKLGEDVARAVCAAEEIAMMRAEVEDLVHRVSGLSDLQQANRCELDRVSSLLRNRENSLDARLADMIERQKRAGAELANLSARLQQLQRREETGRIDRT